MIDLKDIIVELIIELKEIDAETFINEVKQSEEYKNLSPRVKPMIDLIYDEVLKVG